MKQLFANIKLSKKLMIPPLIVMLFLLIFGWVSYTSLSNQKTAMEEVFGNRFKKYQTSATIVKDIAMVHANLYKIINWANATYDGKKIDELGKEQSAVLQRTGDALVKVLKQEALTREEKTLYQAIQGKFGEYQKVCFSAIDLANSDLNMATMYMGNADGKFQTLNQSLHALLDLENKLSQDQYEFSLGSFRSALRILILLMGAALVISFFISLFFTTRMITSPLHKTMEVIKEISEGDLTQELDVTSKDEIGELAQSVDVMRQKMGEAVGQSVAMSQSLSQSATEQAASLEETSASLEEMTSMTKRNAGNATVANQLMTVTREVIEKADGSMGELTGSMKEITSSSEKTQKIVKTIDEIAFQTNLLALNAAVEAARAGEAGAGFAVVADEVRNLALRAAEAAKNTSGLIEDIVRKVNNGERLVGVTNGAFREITDSSLKVVNLIGEIAGASQEQSQGIEQVNKAVAEMNKMTQQNAAGAEELASVMAMFRTNGYGSVSLKEKARTSFSSYAPHSATIGKSAPMVQKRSDRNK